MNDTRVPVWQTAKFAARRQELTVSEKPILLSVDFEGSYKFDAPENKQEKELTAVLVFASRKSQNTDNQLNN